MNEFSFSQWERSTDFQVHSYSIEICSWKMPRHTHTNSFDALLRRFFFRIECTFLSKLAKCVFWCYPQFIIMYQYHLTSKARNKCKSTCENKQVALYRRHIAVAATAAATVKKNVERLCLYLTMKSHEQAELKYIVASHCNWENAVNPWANTPKAFWLCDIATSFVSLFTAQTVNIPRFVLSWPIVIRLVIDLIRRYLFIIYKMSFPQQSFSPSIYYSVVENSQTKTDFKQILFV